MVVRLVTHVELLQTALQGQKKVGLGRSEGGRHRGGRREQEGAHHGAQRGDGSAVPRRRCRAREGSQRLRLFRPELDSWLASNLCC